MMGGFVSPQHGVWVPHGRRSGSHTMGGLGQGADGGVL